MDSFKKRREQAIVDTRKKLNAALNSDQHIILLAKAIGSIDANAQDLGKRLFDWYSYYGPELTFHITDHFQFALLVTQHSKAELYKKYNLKDDSGATCSPAQVKQIVALAQLIVDAQKLKDQYEQQIEVAMKKTTPNLLAMTSPLIGSKILLKAGSLERLAKLPGSVIQTLGAEDALFKHLHQNKRPPKYGVLYEHPLVQKSKAKGNVARSLAAKMALACRMDFYGADKKWGDKMLIELKNTYAKRGWLA